MNRVSKGLLSAGLAVTMEFGGSSYLRAYAGNWDIAGINDSVISFRNGVSITTSLYDVHFVGRLQSEKNSMLLIFSGKDCRDCCSPNAIFLYSPTDKKVIEPGYAPYDYPGTEYSPGDSTVVYTSRMFYGRVLPSVPNGIIWYQEMLGDDGNYMRSVYLVRLDKNRMKEELILENPPPIEETLYLLQANQCHELGGVDYISEE